MQTASMIAKPPLAAEFTIPVYVREMDNMQEPERAYIRRVNTGFFLIAAPIAIKPERRVEVVFEGRPIECQVVYCHSGSADNYHLGVRMVLSNGEALRAEPRIPVDLEAKLHLPGTDPAVPGRVVNISASGLGLVLDKEVHANQPAYAEMEIGFAFGEIRHCSKVRSGYRVGMKLEEFIAREDEVLAARKRSAAAVSPAGFAKLFRRKI
jgi:hypothetical protein